MKIPGQARDDVQRDSGMTWGAILGMTCREIPGMTWRGIPGWCGGNVMLNLFQHPHGEYIDVR